MNHTVNPTPQSRTPDEIALDLTLARNRVRTLISANIDTYLVDDADRYANTGVPASFSQQLIRTLGSAQRYFASTMAQGGFPFTSTPTAAIEFARKRPVLTAAVAAAAVGIVVAAGPKRLFGWAAKMAAIWRVASTLRG
jgi:hypothetical protein